MMRYAGLMVAAVVLAAGWARGDEPVKLSLQPEMESVYAPLEALREEDGVNAGGVGFNLDVTLMSDYIFRGVDRNESGGSEDSLNLQIDGVFEFDLGRLPHPFIGAFMNVYDDDPISRFQEIRPIFGVNWRLRPFTIVVGNNMYIYPDRDDFNTAEVFLKVQLDDSFWFKTESPIFSPYVFAAYDYDANTGEYIEFGISHDFVMEEIPLTLTPQAHVAYVNSFNMFRGNGSPFGSDPSFDFPPTGPDSGFQHYQVGVVAKYRLNQLLNIPKRYGDFDLKGYLFYTDGIENDLRSSTELWGGAGISFSY